MPRSGLFRAAALLAAGVSPLLVGSANADTPGLKGIAPEAPGADKVVPLLADTTQSTNPMDAAKVVKLPSVGQAPVAPQVEAPQVKTPVEERTAVPKLGTLPKLPVGPDALPVPDANVGGVKAPSLPALPVVGDKLPTLG